MKKSYVILAIIIFVLVPGIVFFLVSYHGTNRVYARDLGIHPEAGDLTSAKAKMQAIKDGENKTAVLNSQELTAWLGGIEKPDTPVKDTQVKINKDDTVEISGLLATDQVVPYAASHGISAQAAKQALDQLGSSGDVPVYMHLSGNIRDGRLNLKIIEIQLDDMTIPNFILKGKKNEIRQLLEDEANRNNISTLNIQDGTIAIQRH